MPLGDFTPLSEEEFWGGTSTPTTGPTGQRRSAEDVLAGKPYAEGTLPEGTKVWSEEELQGSLGADTSIMGTARRALDFDIGTPILRGLSNTVSDYMGLSKPSSQGDVNEALSAWAGVGHKDPETGTITGQARFQPGHSNLGEKTEALVAGGRGQRGGADALISAIPGGVIFDQLPEELKQIPRAILEPIIRSGAYLAGSILESPGSMAAMGGAKLIGSQAAKAGTKKAYLASELGQKAAGGSFIAQGVGESGQRAKEAWAKGDMEGLMRAGSETVAQLLLGGMLIRGGIEDARMAKGALEPGAQYEHPIGPERITPPPATIPTPQGAATAAMTGGAGTPGAIPPPQTVASMAMAPPIRRPIPPPGTPSSAVVPSVPRAAVAAPSPPTRTTYQGKPVTVVGRNKAGRVTIQMEDGTKKRVASSQVQGIEGKPTEAITPPPKMEDDLTQLEKELELEEGVAGGAKKLGPKEALDLVWGTVEKGREKATTKMRTFGGVFSPREAETAGAARQNVKPTIRLVDDTKMYGGLAYAPETNILYIKKGTLALLKDMSPEQANAQLVHWMSHEITHKLRPSGAAVNPLTGEEAGKISPVSGHERGGITDSTIKDVEHLRTQERLERLARGRAGKGVLAPKKDLAYTTTASFREEPAAMAKDLYGEKVLSEDESRYRGKVAKPGEVSTPKAFGRKPVTRTSLEEMALSPKDYSKLSPETLKNIFDSQFNALRKSGVPTGDAIRQLMAQVKTENAGKLGPNAKKALQELLQREKGLKAGTPLSTEEAKKVLTGMTQGNVAGHVDVRSRLRDLARIKDPQSLPPDLYLKYKAAKITIGQRVRAAAARIGARGMEDPGVKEAVDLYNELPRLKEGAPKGEAPTELKVARAERVVPPSTPPVLKAAEPSKRAQGLNQRALGLHPRAQGVKAPAAVLGQVTDIASFNRRLGELRRQPMSPDTLAEFKALSASAKAKAEMLAKAADRAEEQYGKTAEVIKTRNTIQAFKDNAAALDARVSKVETPKVAKGRTMEEQLAAKATKAKERIAPPITEQKNIVDLEIEETTITPKQRADLNRISNDPSYPDDIRRQAAEAVIGGTPQDVRVPKLRKVQHREGLRMPRARLKAEKHIPPVIRAENVPGTTEPQRFTESPTGYVKKGLKKEMEAEGRLAPGRAETILEAAAESRKAPAWEKPESIHTRLLRQQMEGEKPATPAPTPPRKGQTKRDIVTIKKQYPLAPPPPTERARAALRAKPSVSMSAPPEGKAQLSDTGGRVVETSRRIKPFSKPVTKLLTRNYYTQQIQSATAAQRALDIANTRGEVNPEAVTKLLETQGVRRPDRALVLEDLRAGRSVAEIKEKLNTQLAWAKRLEKRGQMPELKAGEGRQYPHGAAAGWSYREYADDAGIPQLDTTKAVPVVDDAGKHIGEVHPETGILTYEGGKTVDLINKVHQVKGEDVHFGMAVTPASFQTAMKLGGATRRFTIRDENGKLVRLELPGKGGKVVHAAGGMVMDPETGGLVGRREGGGSSAARITGGNKSGRRAAPSLDEVETNKMESFDEALERLPEGVRRAEGRGAQKEWAEEADVEAMRSLQQEKEPPSTYAQRKREEVEEAGGARSVFKPSTIVPAELMHRAGAGYKETIAGKKLEPVYEGGEKGAGKVVGTQGEREIRTGAFKSREYTRAQTEEAMAARREAGKESFESLDAEARLNRYRSTLAKPRLAPKATGVPDPKKLYKGYSVGLAPRDTQNKAIRTVVRSNPDKSLSIRGLAVAGSRGKINFTEFRHAADQLFDVAKKMGDHTEAQRTTFLQAATKEWNKFNPSTKVARRAPLAGESREAWLKDAYKNEEAKHKIAPPPGKGAGEGPKEIDLEEATIQPKQKKAQQLPLFSAIPKGVPAPPDLNLGQKAYQHIGTFLNGVAQESNAMRALASSGDFSAPFRQAVIYTMSHPVKAAKRAREMVHAWTETNHKALDRALRMDPDFQEASEAGANFVHGTGQHEAFHGSPVAQKQLEKLGPLGRGVSGIVAGSERAYTYYQNAALLDMYKTGKVFLKDVGEWNEKSAQELAKFSNDAVSRTKIPLGEGAQNILTGVFFSPQMQASRAKILSDPFGFRYSTKTGAYARKELGRAVAMGMTLMSAAYNSAQAAGYNATIESDPRSSDFGKVRVGNATIDVWGGYQQMVRAGAQFASGQYKAVSSGRVSKRDRLDTLVQFIRSKLAPGPSLALTLATGKDMIGRESSSVEGIGRAVSNATAPMSARDLFDLWKENPVLAAAAAVPLAMGMNINAGAGRKGSYVDSPSIKEQDQRVGDELRRLKVMPPSLSRRITLTGKNRIGQKYYTTLSGKEWEDFETQAMPEVLDILDAYIKSDTYKALTDIQKTRALAARVRWVNRYKGANVKKRKEAIEKFRAGKLKPSNEWWEEE
jgi:hypothetical protein